MNMIPHLIALAALLFMISPTQSCETWVPIPEANYSREYVPISSQNASTARPLGFKLTNLQFEQTNRCYVVGNTGGNMRHIEIKWDLALSGRLCVKESVRNTEKCNTGKTAKFCGHVPGAASSVTYTFLCKGDGCEGGDKQFWFRFVVEEPREDGSYDENWCSTRDDEYPSTLAPLPSVAPPTTTTKDGGASGLNVMKLSIFVILIFISCVIVS